MFKFSVAGNVAGALSPAIGTIDCCTCRVRVRRRILCNWVITTHEAIDRAASSREGMTETYTTDEKRVKKNRKYCMMIAFQKFRFYKSLNNISTNLSMISLIISVYLFERTLPSL